MPESQQTIVEKKAPPKKKPSLLSFLEPFITAVAPEIGVPLKLAHGAFNAVQGKGDIGDSLTQVSELMKGDEGGDPPPPGPPPLEEESTPEQALASADQQPSGGGMGGGSASGMGGGESPEHDFSPPELASLQQLTKAFPGIDTEIQDNPSLLDGAGNLVAKLKNYYSKQQKQGGVQA